MNEITAFYRIYRPQKVADLDSEIVRNELSLILKSGKVPHAFLFSGTRGTGKTSSARILAKAINCTGKNGFEPCNKCEACISITNGSNVDVIEIDAASNRGIDEIRDLREKIKLLPTSLSKKVYIIDEVHMLTNEAFNALLKTLEEPPPHAFFVLCTTEVHKIPETIISRCQRINFKRATKEEVVRSLKRVVAGEKLDVSDDALLEIAKVSDGSFRDGVKLLEQLSLNGKKITKDEIVSSLGILREKDLESFFDSLERADAKALIGFVDDAFQSGVDLKILNIRILDYLRNLLLLKNGIPTEESVKDLNFTISDLTQLIDLFSRSVIDFKTTVVPQLPLELAIVAWCQTSKLKSGGSAVSELKQQEKVEKKKEEEKKVEVSEKKQEEKKEVKEDEVVEKVKQDTKIALDDFKKNWPEILKSVKPHNHSVEAFLRASSPLSWDGKYLVLEVFYKFHKERLEDDKCRSLIEKIISDMMSESVKLKFVLGEGKKTRVADDVSGKAVPDDIIKAATEIFQGAVVE